MKFAVRIETKTLRVGIHTERCGAAHGRHALTEVRESDSAAELARVINIEEQLAERNLKAPQVCACVHA